MKKLIWIISVTVMLMNLSTQAIGQVNSSVKANNNLAVIKYKYATANNLRIFYREAGNETAPVILLLHGFPSSSHMFRNLIPLLATKFHVIAPDLPGFGLSSSPAHTEFEYSFENLAATINTFTENIGLTKFALYVFDYGAPTGYRIAIAHPKKITGIISQNGNAYEEGLSNGWNPIQKYWKDPTKENRDALKAFFKPETTKWQYTFGTPDSTLVSPDGYTFDQYFLDNEKSADIQLDLFGNYKTNVALYPKFQEYFRKYQPPFLAIWGKNDPFFLPEGAEAYKKDNPKAVVKFLETGHFALETHAAIIAQEILKYFKNNTK